MYVESGSILGLSSLKAEDGRNFKSSNGFFLV